MAGVQIDLIVRGICCLIPEVEGYTDNIQVISIVGRYLEHSRIYIFGKGEDSEVYIASADFMTRNTTKRVEVATPVYSPELKERILESFNLHYAFAISKYCLFRSRNQPKYLSSRPLNALP